MINGYKVAYLSKQLFNPMYWYIWVFDSNTNDAMRVVSPLPHPSLCCEGWTQVENRLFVSFMKEKMISLQGEKSKVLSNLWKSSGKIFYFFDEIDNINSTTLNLTSNYTRSSLHIVDSFWVAADEPASAIINALHLTLIWYFRSSANWQGSMKPILCRQ